MARLHKEKLSPFPHELQPCLDAIQRKVNDSSILRQQQYGLAQFQMGFVTLLPICAMSARISLGHDGCRVLTQSSRAAASVAPRMNCLTGMPVCSRYACFCRWPAGMRSAVGRALVNSPVEAVGLTLNG